MVPWTIMMVFYGTTLSNIHDAIDGNYEAGPVGLTFMIVGSIVAIIASIFLSIVVKRHLNNIVKEAQKNKEKKADIEKANPQAGETTSVIEMN